MILILTPFCSRDIVNHVAKIPVMALLWSHCQSLCCDTGEIHHSGYTISDVVVMTSIWSNG